MLEHFKIFVDQLRDGHIEEISESVSHEFLEVNEAALHFSGEVKFEGQAYLADDELVLHLEIEAVAIMPCSICNQEVFQVIKVKNFYHATPIDEIKGRVFNFSDLLREAVLIEVPYVTECDNGNCPRRKELATYFKKEPPPGSHKLKNGEEGYQPFIDLSYPEEN